MGNRAIIKAKGNNNKGVYLHWNGGRDSVEAFLKYCELRGFRGFDNDYGMARFCQVAGNFFGADGLCIGVTDCVESCGDNGVYIIEGWKIVGREGFSGNEQRMYDLEEMLIAIDQAQPTNQQLGDYLTSKEVKRESLRVGDVVYMREPDGRYKKYTVVGINEDGEPYVNMYCNNSMGYSENPNNYVRSEFVRIPTDVCDGNCKHCTSLDVCTV